MRSILSERNIVVVLFVLVFITFALAQEDSKKMEQQFLGTAPAAPKKEHLVKNEPAHKTSDKTVVIPAAYWIQ